MHVEYKYTINTQYNVLVNQMSFIVTVLCSNFILLEFSPSGDATFNINILMFCLCGSLRLNGNHPNYILNLLFRSFFICISDSHNVSC